jgi:hypothetical protein
MVMKPILFGLLAAGALVTGGAANAERAWILPSATTFSGDDNWATFDAANSSELFYPDHRPLQIDAMKVWAPDGSEGKIENAMTGRRRSTFDIHLDKPGTWKVGTQTSMVMGSFMLNGEERRVGRFGGAPGPGRPGEPARKPPVAVADIPPEATDVKLTEVVSRNEVYVTEGEPTTTVFAPTAKGIELQPVTHPDELIKGETATFRFLVDGRPQAGVAVTVVPGGKRYRDQDESRSFTTAADGTVRIDWPAAGMYWIDATLTDDKPSEPKAQQRRMSYMTTVEVLLP